MSLIDSRNSKREAQRVLWRVILSMINRGWTEVDGWTLILDRPLGYWQQIAMARNPGTARRSFQRQWDKATAWVAENPVRVGYTEVHLLLAQVAARVEEHPERFAGANGAYDRRALTCLLDFSKRANRLTVTVSTRQAAEHMCCTQAAAQKALARLAAKETFVRKISTGKATSRWIITGELPTSCASVSVGLPSREKGPTADTAMREVPQAFSRQALGLTSLEVYEQLPLGARLGAEGDAPQGAVPRAPGSAWKTLPSGVHVQGVCSGRKGSDCVCLGFPLAAAVPGLLTAQELASVTSRHRTTIKRALLRLAEVGAVAYDETYGGYVRLPVDLDKLAVDLGVAVVRLRLTVRHRKARMKYYDHQCEVKEGAKRPALVKRSDDFGSAYFRTSTGEEVWNDGYRGDEDEQREPAACPALSARR